jgi:hypothetical protein
MNTRIITACDGLALESGLAPVARSSQTPELSGKPRFLHRAFWMALATYDIVGVAGCAYLHYAGKYEEPENVFMEADAHLVNLILPPCSAGRRTE